MQRVYGETDGILRVAYSGRAFHPGEVQLLLDASCNRSYVLESTGAYEALRIEGLTAPFVCKTS